MPIYEYTCSACETRFEKLVRSMSGREKIECPKCGSAKTARTLSVFAVNSVSPKSNSSTSPGLCNRCGGPGPCAME